jgi:aminobenzoyl-glutamate utilization protein B
MHIRLFFCLAILSLVSFTKAQPDSEKQAIIKALNAQADTYTDMAHQIWDWAELGFQEDQSTELLQSKLREAGFRVESGVAGMPTAFVATYGSGEPVIGYLAEFDALPGVSQQAVPRPAQRPETNNGHACGHHLFGTGSVAAAVAVKDWMEQSGVQGTLRLYGTPAEEGGGGKIYMVREGLFDDVDAVLTWHPSSSNSAVTGSSLAVITVKFRFEGAAAHAAVAPWRGRSALDGVEAMNYMVNLMREHVTPATRIHYAITEGAEAPNVVPAFAEVYYIIRHDDMTEVKDLFRRVVLTSEAAAMGTETKVSHEVITGYFNKLPNEVLGRIMNTNLQMVGGVEYTDEERQFAEEIMTSYPSKDMSPDDAASIEPFQVREKGYASTDVGDISWVTPTTSMGAATWVPGTVAHSWQAVAAGGTTIGPKGMMVAAKTLALSAVDIFRDPSIAEKAREELRKRRGTDFTYEALLGDREPPLDYMKKSK